MPEEPERREKPRPNRSGKQMRSSLERGGGGKGYPTRNRAGDAPAAHRTLITRVSGNNYEWESDRGAFKNRRKSNWRGRKRCLQYGTKTKRLAKRPRTLCHRKAGTDGNTTSSWMNDWRANTLGSTRRANTWGKWECSKVDGHLLRGKHRLF